jgi:hypothetical protein
VTRPPNSVRAGGDVPDWFWIQNVVFPIIGMGMASFVLFGVYKTVNKVLDRRHEARLHTAGGPVPELVRRLEQRVTDLEGQVERVQELEERLDFAERMLAQQRQQPLLGDH